jgi:hypothetical protein
MHILGIRDYVGNILDRWFPLPIAIPIIFLHFMFFRRRGYPPTITPFAVLVNDPLDKPFGQCEETLSPCHLLNGTEYGASLDNGMYLLVFYFGWAGIALLALLIIRMLMIVFSLDGIKELILLAFVLSSLQFSGGILLPEYVLLLVMALYQFKLPPLVSTHGVVQRAGYYPTTCND